MIVDQKHKKVDWKKSAVEQGFVYTVSIPWKNQSGKWWNDQCADVLEVFGLPGERFMSSPNMQSMEFHFKSEKDAQLCQILLSENI